MLAAVCGHKLPRLNGLICGATFLQRRRQISRTVILPPTSPRVIFSGIQPTGIPHIGNYLGALQQWVHLQNTSSPDAKLLFSIVDLHALTVRQPPEQLRKWRRETLASLLALGLDPNRCTIFFQADVRLRFISKGIGNLHCSRSQHMRS
jgi:hypothetical protein